MSIVWYSLAYNITQSEILVSTCFVATQGQVYIVLVSKLCFTYIITLYCYSDNTGKYLINIILIIIIHPYILITLPSLFIALKHENVHILDDISTEFLCQALYK